MPHKIQIFQVELKSNQQHKVGTKLLRTNPKNGIQLYSLNFASNYLYQICPNAIFLISGVYVIIFFFNFAGILIVNNYFTWPFIQAEFFKLYTYIDVNLRNSFYFTRRQTYCSKHCLEYGDT